MKKNVVIVIPIYNSFLTEYERISMDRALEVFFKYDIFFIAPESLIFNMENNIKIKRFHDYYFQSTDKYSELLLSIDFYRVFCEYKYMLIYQLDAFVFYDRLEYFCTLGYDYIGAPWIDGMLIKVSEKYKVSFVGNGGLSLRNIQNTIQLLEDFSDEVPCFQRHEDLFFSYHNYNKFKVATVGVALQFSFETKVERCFRLNKKEIPFGCHAWERYNLEFWRPYIEECGYSINQKDLKNGNQDKKIEVGIIRKILAYLLRKTVDLKKY